MTSEQIKKAAREFLPVRYGGKNTAEFPPLYGEYKKQERKALLKRFCNACLKIIAEIAKRLQNPKKWS